MRLKLGIERNEESAVRYGIEGVRRESEGNGSYKGKRLTHGLIKKWNRSDP